MCGSILLRQCIMPLFTIPVTRVLASFLLTSVRASVGRLVVLKGIFIELL